MEELIFFALIAFASIIESVFRRWKARSGGGPVKEAPTGDRQTSDIQFEWGPGRADELPTYDSDPSYDELATVEETETSTEPFVPTPPSMLEKILEAASEAMEDPNEEGRLRQKLEKRDKELRRMRLDLEKSKRSGASRRGSVGKPASHHIHRTHAEFGTDPSERAPSEQDGLDPLARALSAEAKAVRRQLRSDSASSLRQAIVLQEVLGPPKAMQGDPSS